MIPALLRRFHEAVQSNAPEVVIWGSGTPMREFLHVDDMAAASVHVMELGDETYRRHTKTMQSHINVGTGVDCTVRELAETIARVTGFRGRLGFDASKPDGTPRKLMDVSRGALSLRDVRRRVAFVQHAFSPLSKTGHIQGDPRHTGPLLHHDPCPFEPISQLAVVPGFG